MAFPLGAVIAGGATLLGAGGTAYAQGKTNKKTREFNQHMYLQQRGDNIWAWNQQNQYNQGLWNQQNQYNEDMWNKMNRYSEERWNIENQYNSPQAQMQRFKEAGLNPNLIYGQGNMGGHVSTANLETPIQGRGDLKGANYGSWNPKAPEFDLQSGVMAYNAFREQSARTNNLEATNDLIKQDTALRGVQTANEAKKGQLSGIALKYADQLGAISLQAAEENVRKTTNEIELSRNKDSREAALNKSHLMEAIQRMRQSKAAIGNIAMDIKLKQLEYKLKSNEITLRNAWSWLKENFSETDWKGLFLGGDLNSDYK